MAYRDDELGIVFPTRTGSIGAANERQMLDSLHDTAGIRTKLLLELDKDTRLKTRAGNPEFVVTKKESGALVFLRGFLARIAAATKALLFIPATLLVRTTKYVPPAPAYSVLPRQTSTNPKGGGDAKWSDVLAVYDGKLFLNGKPTKAFGVFSFALPSGGIPVTFTDPYSQLAGAVVLASPTGAGVSGAGTFIPIYPPNLNDIQILTGGLRVDTVGVTMTQLYYVGSAWDNASALWYLSATSVVWQGGAPYLTSIDAATCVDLGAPSLGAPATTNPNSSVNVTLPDVIIAYTGVYEIAFTQVNPPGSEASGYIEWIELQAPVTDYVSQGLPGRVDTGTTRVERVGDLSGIFTLPSGEVVSYAGSVSKTTTGNNETYYSLPATISHPFDGGPFEEHLQWTALGGSDYDPYWASAPVTGAMAWGDTWNIAGGFQSVTQAHYDDATYESSASIQLGTRTLLVMSASRYDLSGFKITPHPVDKRLATLPHWGWVGFEGATTNIVLYADQPAPLPPAMIPIVYAKADAALQERANEYVGLKFYYPGTFDIGRTNPPYYTATADALTPTSSGAASWTTRDFLHYDKTEDIYVYIQGDYSGTRGTDGSTSSQTLLVTLKIEVRGATYSQTLASLSPGGNVCELYTPPGGVPHVPCPPLRAIFNPIYRDQGNFPGAAYTTKGEEARGAVPAVLFNFTLTLGIYADLGVARNYNARVVFTPYLLIEMLYAYLFSYSYGLDPGGKYVVTRPAVYDYIVNAVFAKTWHVTFRNDAFVDWMDSFGGEYATNTSAELYRI